MTEQKPKNASAETKKTKRQQRAKALKQRTAYLLRLAITNATSVISEKDFADAVMDRINPIDPNAGDAQSTLLRYIKGQRVPSPIKAWAIGEGLRRLGIDWMNGLCMLWAVGQYDVALATTFEYVVQRSNRPTAEEVDMLWSAALAGVSLPDYRFHFDFDFTSSAIRNALGENPLEPARHNPSPPPVFPTDDVPDQTPLLMNLRTRIQDRWRAMVPLIKTITPAFLKALEGEYRPRHRDIEGDPWAEASGANAIAAGALEIARSSALSIEAVETSLLIMLGQYLNTLDPALNNGSRSLSFTPRPQPPFDREDEDRVS